MSEQKEETKPEELKITELEERIQKMYEQGKDYNKIFLWISNGWQYGSLKLRDIRTLLELREVIFQAIESYKERKRLEALRISETTIQIKQLDLFA